VPDHVYPANVPHHVWGYSRPPGGWAVANEAVERDEWTAYVTLLRMPTTYRGIAYGARALGQRSPHSSLRAGEPPTWRRGTGSRCEGREAREMRTAETVLSIIREPDRHTN